MSCIGRKLRKIGPIAFSRQLWTGQVQFYNRRNTAEMQGRLLRKMMTGGSRKKWYKDSFGSVERLRPTSVEFLKPKNTQVVRRVHVLNSVILQTVTDVMSTGELCPELSGLGLELTQVKVSSDFSSVNIYWTTSMVENTGILERKLQPYAGKLKNIMCGLSILGNVPHVNFTKDRRFQNLKDVEYALARADFGPDFEPTDKSHYRRTSTVFGQQHQTTTNEDTLSEREPLTATTGTGPPPSPPPPPPMRMDIFHLNHQEITDKIVRNMNRAKAAHRTSESGIPTRFQRDDDENLRSTTEKTETVGKRVTARLPRMPDTDSELRRLLRRNAKRIRGDSIVKLESSSGYMSDYDNQPQDDEEEDFYDDEGYDDQFDDK